MEPIEPFAQSLGPGDVIALEATTGVTRTMRRLTNRRVAGRARHPGQDEAHGVLARNLCVRPPVTDCFGKAGRRWLAGLELPIDKRLTLDGCLCQVDFLDAEIAVLDREIARLALAWPQVLRLMSVPGVNVRTAATFMASVGDVRRVSSARARRGPQIAATATARKLVVLFWHLLTREEDDAFARPAMTRNKIRKLELLAGPPPQKGRTGIAGGKSQRTFDAERELSRQAEPAYRRLVSDWKAARPAKAGAGATPGRASRRSSKDNAARQTP